MNEFSIDVRITPRDGLLDPQGKAVQHALESLEFEEVSEVRIGRLVRLRVRAADRMDAETRVEAMCRQLLANPVTEDYSIEVTAK